MPIISAGRTNFKDLNTVFMLAWYGEYLSNNDNGIWKSFVVVVVVVVFCCFSKDDCKC